MQSVSRAMRTDNPAINALLRAKLADCEAAGVLTEMDVSGSWRELPMPAWEMCRVFSDLMDNAIEALEDERQRNVMRLYYLNGLTWEQVAERMHYSREWVCRLHRKAIKEVTKSH